MLRISVEHARRDFTLAASLTAPSPGITVIFGPSGAGKTSLLQAVAGLARADQVRVELDGVALHRLPAHRRRIGMVFQEGRLFPHLNVRGNLNYGMRRAPKGNISPATVVGVLGLEKLLGRWPWQLSGGERQRVAIGRALLSQPLLLLMDEPLAGLDAGLRAEIMPYLAELRAKLRLPVLYVTHSTEEMARLADHVVLLERGRVAGAGTLEDVSGRLDLPLSALPDAAAYVSGQVLGHHPERGLSEIACGGQVFWVPICALAVGAPVRLRLGAREVMLALSAPRDISVANVLAASVSAVALDQAGRTALVELDIGAGALLARISADAVERLYLRAGSRVFALVKSTSLEIFLL